MIFGLLSHLCLRTMDIMVTHKGERAESNSRVDMISSVFLVFLSASFYSNLYS